MNVAPIAAPEPVVYCAPLPQRKKGKKHFAEFYGEFEVYRAEDY